MRKTPRQSGVALIEFALVLPFLLILTLVAIEYGRALHQYNTLAKSVRDAVRYLSVQNPGNSGIQSNAKNLVVYGNLSGTGAPLALGLALNQVRNPEWSLAGADPVINTVTVRIAGCATSPAPCYRFVPLLSSVFGQSFGAIDYADISASMRAPL